MLRQASVGHICWTCLDTYPYGSKCPDSRVSGPKSHSKYGFWDLTPYYVGTRTLWVLLVFDNRFQDWVRDTLHGSAEHLFIIICHCRLCLVLNEGRGYHAACWKIFGLQGDLKGTFKGTLARTLKQDPCGIDIPKDSWNRISTPRSSAMGPAV